MNSADEARAALASADVARLIGTAESDWLDAKSQHYKTDNPASKAELLKDVTGLANHRGGLLLIGYTAPKTAEDREVIDAVVPVSNDRGTVEKYRQCLRDNVMPLISGLRVEAVSAGSGGWVFVIDVPEQKESDKPFTIPGPTAGKQGSVSIALRDGDQTHWFTRAQIHGLLSAGVSSAGGRFEDLARVVTQAATHAATEAASRAVTSASREREHVMVGEGVPGYTRSFGGLYNAVWGPSSIGMNNGPVREEGPVVVQYFESVSLPDYMVICAWPSHPPVAMPGSVWDALRRTGDGIAALGLPDPDSFADPDKRLVAFDATEVELSGGTWGPGRLLRAGTNGSWRWEPKPQVNRTVTGMHAWYGDAVGNLRLRAYATLPWRGQSKLTIDKAGRQRLLDALTDCELSKRVAALSAARGADLAIGAWNMDDGGRAQSSSSARYTAAVAGPDGRPALTAKAMINCPNTMQPVVTTAAEVRIDPEAWREALETAGAHQNDLRVRLHEVLELFVSAWTAATTVLPLTLVPDPTAQLLAGVPRVEFYLESPTGVDGPSPDLRTFVDFSAFGERSSDPLTQMVTALIAPVAIDDEARRTWAIRALIDMAQQLGFVDADADDLN